jgi:hypothetical protein
MRTYNLPLADLRMLHIILHNSRTIHTHGFADHSHAYTPVRGVNGCPGPVAHFRVTLRRAELYDSIYIYKYRNIVIDHKHGHGILSVGMSSPHLILCICRCAPCRPHRESNPGPSPDCAAAFTTRPPRPILLCLSLQPNICGAVITTH